LSEIKSAKKEPPGLTAVIELLGCQKTAAGVGSVEFPVGNGETVLDALNFTAERYPSIYLDPERVIFSVNGERSPADSVLQAGDIVRFLPVLGGG